jgi:aerobic carbon-monoxide dehydrogenase small subunit
MLAQIAREGLVRDLATRLTADFARNLGRQLSGETGSEFSRQAISVNGLTLIFDVLRIRARRIASKFWGQ